jgi:uncharacterized protein
MGSNADTLRDAYDAFGRGDRDAVTAAWTDDIRWDGSNNPELPGGGRHEGKDAVVGALAAIADSWDDFRVTPDEFHESGDTVIVLGHANGKAKKTGEEGQWPFVHVWRMQDGKAREALILADTLYVAKLLGVA